jgi:acetoin utilization deacetylase AcuC-like enzyme
MRVYFSPAFGATGVAFDTTRKAVALARSLEHDPIAGVELVEPTPATRDELTGAHDAGYVDAVLTGQPLDLALTNDLPGWDAGFATAVCASNGGVRDAALHALGTNGIAGSLSSGLHHASAARGAGYCTFNGLVLAARAAIAAGAKRILVIDLDAHCGGGTASMIGAVPGIEQIDVSVDPFDHYVSRDDARLVMADGSDYVDVVSGVLGRVDDPNAIDLVLYNAGMDPHHAAGGVEGIDAAVLAERERIVFDWAAAWSLPVAWVLAGGYTEGAEHAVLTMDGLVGLHRLTIEAAAAVRPARS